MKDLMERIRFLKSLMPQEYKTCRDCGCFCHNKYDETGRGYGTIYCEYLDRVLTTIPDIKSRPEFCPRERKRNKIKEIIDLIKRGGDKE